MIGEIENVGDNSGIVSAIGLHSGTSSGTDSGMAANDLQNSVSSLISDSVTFFDWIMDFLTQFHVKVFDFETGRDMMMKPKLPRQTLRARDLRQLCLIAKVTIVLLLM